MAPFLILIVLIWCDIAIVFTEGEELSWSCNFENDDCSIMQENNDDGAWKRNWAFFGGNKYYYADFDRFQSSAIVKCTLPLGFSATTMTTGRLFFHHYTSDSNLLKLKVCRGGAVYTLETTERNWLSYSIPIDCRHSTIDISFEAVRGTSYGQPDLRIDNILVYRNIASTTNPPATAEKPTTEKAGSTVSLSTSTSPSSSYKSSTATRHTSLSGTSITSVTFAHTTIQGTPRKVETTTSRPQSPLNPKMPNTGKEKDGTETTIISIVVVGVVFLVIITIIILIALRRRRMARQNNGTPDLSKQPDGNVYTNTAFSASGVDTDQTDVIRGVCFRNGPGSPHLSTPLTNPGRSLSHHQEEGYLEHGEEHPYALGQGDYTDLKGLDESKHQEENGELEYFVLEGPSNVGNDRQQGRLEPCDAEDQVYDHLNRDNVNTNDAYGAAAVLSDRDNYDILARLCETELNQRKRQDVTHPKKTTTEGAQDVENEYHTLSPVDEKNSKLFDNIDENNYNVLRETVDDVDRNDISPKTSEGDNTTRDDYHILHSGKELDDYHEYQYPDHPLFSGSTNNAVSRAKENEGRNHDYFVGRGESGNNELQRAESSSTDADEQAYDHLNRDVCNVTMAHGQGLKGRIKETSSKGKREQGDDHYSVVNVQDQVGTGYEQHEPLYSSEVYSELA